jgi:plasmid stabilization system protein ParE
MQSYNVDIPPIVIDKIKQQAHIIALDKPAAALAWYDTVFDKIFTLEAMPNRCPIAPENQFVTYEVRHLLIGQYRVLFRVVGDTVRVLDFKGGKQNKPA